MLDERDKQLIKEREDYENNFLEEVVDEMMESDALDELIAQRFKYIDRHFEFEPSPEFLRLEEFYYQQFDPEYPSDEYQDYMPQDDLSDNLNGLDYPEGYDDIVELEPFIDTDDEYLDVPDFDESEAYEEMLNEYLEKPPEYVMEIFYEEDIEEVFEDYLEEDESQVHSLINQYLQQEREYFDRLLVDVIQEERYFEKAIDELILGHTNEKYNPEDFDYVVENENYYWFDEPMEENSSYWPDEDESVKDPFDSFDEIDYPEGGEPIPHYEPHFEEGYDEIIQRDFEKFEGQKRRKLAKKYQERKLISEFDSKLKEMFTKGDTLDRIIKHRLKEEKF